MCRFVCDFWQLHCLSLEQADAGMTNRLAQALRQPGIEVTHLWPEEAEGRMARDYTLPRLSWVSVHVEYVALDQPTQQEAIAAVLSSFTGVHLTGGLGSAIRQELTAVALSNEAGLWLLPALAHVTALLTYHPFNPNIMFELCTALQKGYLPRLQHLIFPHIPDRPYELRSLAQVLKARSGLQINTARSMNVVEVERLRAAVAAVPSPGALSSRQRVTRSSGAPSSQPPLSLMAVTLDHEERRLLLERMLC